VHLAVVVPVFVLDKCKSVTTKLAAAHLRFSALDKWVDYCTNERNSKCGLARAWEFMGSDYGSVLECRVSSLAD
jgi:hypothetical protein